VTDLLGRPVHVPVVVHGRTVILGLTIVQIRALKPDWQY